jgi:UDP-N-acetylglucosamine--N-acetylmuramyl-(pentapeptide) pyrophosphoryl-undecaprenol N-acetylglucosamine transferase
MEEKLVAREGFTIKTVKVSSFKRKLTPAAAAKNLKTLFGLRAAVVAAKKMLTDFKPDVVVGTGGYASYPAISAASALGIPCAIHESNAVPGLTSALLASKADRIMTGFEGGVRRYPEKTVLTGTPVREEFIYNKKEDAKRALGIGDEPLVVSVWGSLGAREMNKKTAEFIVEEAKEMRFRHIHATGSFGWRWMHDYIRSLGAEPEKIAWLELREYIYDMPTVMAAADLVICRAGASTTSEIIASSTPAILVPSPNVAGNHQEKNARALEKLGGCIVVEEKHCNGKSLYQLVCDLLTDKNRLADISAAQKRAAIPDASERIYKVISELAGERNR